MKRPVIVLAVAIAALAVGILVVNASQPRPTTANPAVLIAGPPAEPCVFPDAQELAVLASNTDLVAIGSVEGNAQVVRYSGISSTYTRYAVRVQSILRQKSAASPARVIIEELGGVPVPILQPGPYVLFLVKTARGDGVETYFVANGLKGAFPVRNAAVFRECADAHAPANAIQASGAGQGMSEASFADEVRNLPAVDAPPHK